VRVIEHSLCIQDPNLHKSLLKLVLVFEYSQVGTDRYEMNVNSLKILNSLFKTTWELLYTFEYEARHRNIISDYMTRLIYAFGTLTLPWFYK
jgi:hypothetical protein